MKSILEVNNEMDRILFDVIWALDAVRNAQELGSVQWKWANRVKNWLKREREITTMHVRDELESECSIARVNMLTELESIP